MAAKVPRPGGPRPWVQSAPLFFFSRIRWQINCYIQFLISPFLIFVLSLSDFLYGPLLPKEPKKCQYLKTAFSFYVRSVLFASRLNRNHIRMNNFNSRRGFELIYPLSYMLGSGAGWECWEESLIASAG